MPKPTFKINFGGSLVKTAKEKSENLPAKVKMNYVGEPSYENDASEEMTAIKAAFKAHAKNENDRRDDYTDTNFYSNIIFSNASQRAAFFKALGMDIEDSTDIRFINGILLAKMLKIELPTASAMPPDKFKQSKDVLKLAHLPKPKVKQGKTR